MRIAQIVAGLGGAGLEKMVADLSLALVSRGHDVEVFNLGMAGVHQARLEKQGTRVNDCQRGWWRIPGFNRRLRSGLARFRPDILHAHSGTWYHSAAARRSMPATRLVFTDHGRYESEGALLSLLLQRWCASFIDRLVAVSEPLSEQVHTALRLKELPVVIENGIDLAPYSLRDPVRRQALRQEWGFTDAEVVVVIVGRLEPVKNHQGLLEAMALALVRAPNLRLAIVGVGSLDAEVRAVASSLGISDSVRFLGFSDDVPGCVLASDIFAMPSHTEGLPLALLEGMAAGLPIVASPVGGIPAALGSQPNWLLPKPGDTAALADALTRLAGDRRLREEFGSHLRGHAKNFSLEKMTSRYEDLYRSCRSGVG